MKVKGVAFLTFLNPYLSVSNLDNPFLKCPIVFDG